MILKYLFSSCKQSFSPGFKKRYTKLLNDLPLARYERNIISERYVRIVSAAENDYRRTCILYIILTNLITISGVFIVGLLSIEKMSDIDVTSAKVIFWIVWSLSILLTLANKWLYSFNIHKKYVLNIAILEKLYSEGWLFAAGVGRYKKYVDCSDRFKLFCTRIEKLKMKSLESMPEMESHDIANEILATGTITTPGGSADSEHIYPVDLRYKLQSRRSKLVLFKKNSNDDTDDNIDSSTDDQFTSQPDQGQQPEHQQVHDHEPAEEHHDS